VQEVEPVSFWNDPSWQSTQGEWRLVPSAVELPRSQGTKAVIVMRMGEGEYETLLASVAVKAMQPSRVPARDEELSAEDAPVVAVVTSSENEKFKNWPLETGAGRGNASQPASGAHNEDDSKTSALICSDTLSMVDEFKTKENSGFPSGI